MPGNKGKGRVSYRGAPALGIGLVFLWFAVKPEHFKEAPPLLVRVIMLAASAGLAYGGVLSMRHIWKRGNLVRSNAPVAAEICVLEDDDSDRGPETVHVRANGRCQAMGVDRSGAVQKYVDGIVCRGEVWLDANDTVYAVAIWREHFNTLIGGREIPEGRFGAKAWDSKSTPGSFTYAWAVKTRMEATCNICSGPATSECHPSAISASFLTVFRLRAVPNSMAGMRSRDCPIPSG